MRRLVLLSAALLGLPIPAATDTYVVHPDGTGDFPTIQAALDAVLDGDTIELTNGTFTGPGNRDLDYLGKAITIRSQGGDPHACTIDCGGSASSPHRGVYFHSAEGPGSVLEGITITGGHAEGEPGTPEQWGGAVLCYETSPSIIRCVVTGNHADVCGGGVMAYYGAPMLSGCSLRHNSAGWGGGVYCRYAPTSPLIQDCTFEANEGTVNGGGLCDDHSSCEVVRGVFVRNSTPGRGGGMICDDSPTAIANCTFYANHASDHAGGIWILNDAAPSVTNSIIAGSTSGEAIYSDGGTPSLSCCDIYGNAGGDWTGPIAQYEGLNGNFSADPCFCDMENDDYHCRVSDSVRQNQALS